MDPSIEILSIFFNRVIKIVSQEGILKFFNRDRGDINMLKKIKMILIMFYELIYGDEREAELIMERFKLLLKGDEV